MSALRVVIFSVLVLSVQCGCPLICTCKWKGGKQTVECKSQGLDSVPRGLDLDTQVLDLSGNHVAQLSAAVFRYAGLLNLQRLHIRNSRLHSVHALAFAQLNNLVELDLSDNFLKSVPFQAFNETPYLRELNLAGNPISRVSGRAFQHLPNLLKLDLSSCHIQEIQPNAFTHLTKLEMLKINSNQLTVLTNQTVQSLRQLHGVELHDNPWHCDCALTALKVWMTRNIPHPLSPICHSPSRVAGRAFSELPVSEFACAPRILDNRRHVVVQEGDNATLDCEFEATPRPSVRWYLFGRPIANNTVLSAHRKFLIYQQWQKSRLILTNTMSKDDGELFCVVENAAGFVEANFSLSVEIPPPHSPHLLALASLLSVILVILALLLPVLLCLRARKRPVPTMKPPAGPLNHMPPLAEMSKGENNDNPDLILETSSYPQQQDDVWPNYPTDYGLPMMMPPGLIHEPPALPNVRGGKVGARITAPSARNSPDEGYQEGYVGTDV